MAQTWPDITSWSHLIAKKIERSFLPILKLTSYCHNIIMINPTVRIPVLAPLQLYVELVSSGKVRCLPRLSISIIKDHRVYCQKYISCWTLSYNCECSAYNMYHRLKDILQVTSIIMQIHLHHFYLSMTLLRRPTHIITATNSPKHWAILCSCQRI